MSSHEMKTIIESWIASSKGSVSDDFYKVKVRQKKSFVNFILVLNKEYANTDQQIIHCLSLKANRKVSTSFIALSVRPIFC
jgi:hypothetical protein